MASSSPISSAKGDGAPPRSVIIETGHLFVGQLPACWRMHDLQSFHLCGSLFIKDQHLEELLPAGSVHAPCLPRDPLEPAAAPT